MYPSVLLEQDSVGAGNIMESQMRKEAVYCYRELVC